MMIHDGASCYTDIVHGRQHEVCEVVCRSLKQKFSQYSPLHTNYIIPH